MIPITDMHRKKNIVEVEMAILNMQEGVYRNATTHKAWAVNESVGLAELQAIITDTINAYEQIRAKLRHFRDVTLVNDPDMLTVGAAIKADIASVAVVGQAVADEIDIFAAMPRTTYAEIIAACDYLISNVNPPQSVWD